MLSSSLSKTRFSVRLFIGRPQGTSPSFRSQALALKTRALKESSGDARPSSAKEAIESGLLSFNQKKSYAEAVQLFSTALELNPSEDEAMAALYNLGCAYTKQKQWKPAAEAIVRAINDHKLKLSVALKDDDLRELRDRREWIDALTEVKGGMSRDMKIGLRSEAKAPFRFPRVFLFWAVAVGSAAGLVIITGRLVLALQGGEGAPDLTESVTNFAINSGVLAVVSALLYRESKAKAKSVEVTDREELLSRLQIDLGGGRVLPLLKFRGQLRPVVIAGSKTFVDRAVRAADPYMLQLRLRGVSVVPLVLNDSPAAPGRQPDLDPDAKILALKREFQRSKDTSKGFGSVKPEKGPDEAAAAAPESGAVGIADEDKKWKLAAYDVDEWQGWVQQQKQFANLTGEQRNCFIQVQLDGTVRSSALGTPNWGKLIDDLPPLDDIRTSLSDGVGTDV